MKYHNHNNNIEVIIFPNHASKEVTQQELEKWLVTIGQTIIDKQQVRMQNFFAGVLNDAPPIHLS